MKKFFIFLFALIIPIFLLIVLTRKNLNLDYESSITYFKFLATFPEETYQIWFMELEELAYSTIFVPDFSGGFVDVVYSFFEYLFNLFLGPVKFAISTCKFLFNLLEFFVNFVKLLIT